MAVGFIDWLDGLASQSHKMSDTGNQKKDNTENKAAEEGPMNNVKHPLIRRGTAKQRINDPIRMEMHPN